ncbi:MAG: hypothetical protein Q8L57_03545 [bacterium]|nr:hypothetical protein [bacterium]
MKKEKNKKTSDSKTKVEIQKTPAEIFFEKITEVVPSGDRTRAVNDMVLPVFGKIFYKEENKKQLPMVKLQEEFGGSMLTYVVFRQISQDDVANAKNLLSGAGFRILDATTRDITASKDAKTMVFSFNIENPQKGVITITF